MRLRASNIAYAYEQKSPTLHLAGFGKCSLTGAPNDSHDHSNGATDDGDGDHHEHHHHHPTLVGIIPITPFIDTTVIKIVSMKVMTSIVIAAPAGVDTEAFCIHRRRAGVATVTAAS